MASADVGQRADALPPSYRDAGNRASLAGLRSRRAPLYGAPCVVNTRDSDFGDGVERNRACNPSYSARFRDFAVTASLQSATPVNPTGFWELFTASCPISRTVFFRSNAVGNDDATVVVEANEWLHLRRRLIPP